MLKIDVNSSRELKAAVLAQRRANAEVRADVNATVRREIGGRWQSELNSRASTALEQRVILAGARARGGTDRFSLVAASSRRPLRNGLIPASQWAGAEFGARSRRATIQTRSPKGTPYRATKMLNRQFRGREYYGRIAFDAASAIGTWSVSQWVRFIVDAYKRAAEGKP